MKFTFNKHKYAKELLIDCERMSDVKHFTTDSTPFLVDFYELFFITAGTGTFLLDDERIPFAPGTILLLPPNKWRQWANVDGALDGYFLIFEEDFMSSFFNDSLFLFRFHFFHNSSTPSFVHSDAPSFAKYIDQLLTVKRELLRLDGDSEHFLRATLYLLLMEINRAYSAQFHISGEFFEDNLTLRFRKLLEQEVRLHHHVSHYAEHLGVSTSHLSKTLQTSLGKSTSELLRARLAAEAKRELLFGSLSVAEVSYALHFSEPSNFNRFFKQVVGMPPKEFRQQYAKG